jgi:putative transposase
VDGEQSVFNESHRCCMGLVAPLLPPAGIGGRRCTTDLRAVLDAIFYLLRSGCQWRLLPRDFPAWGTVYRYFRSWKNMGVWTRIQREIYEQVQAHAGRSGCPSVVIMDGQSVKTTERGGVRGFDRHKHVKGRKRHVLVDTLGLPITNPSNPRTYRTARWRSTPRWFGSAVPANSDGNRRCGP